MNEIVSQPSCEEMASVPRSESFTIVKEEWFRVEPRLIFMIGNGQEEVKLGQESEKKLVHTEALFTVARKFATVSVKTSSSCNVLQGGYC